MNLSVWLFGRPFLNVHAGWDVTEGDEEEECPLPSLITCPSCDALISVSEASSDDTPL